MFFWLIKKNGKTQNKIPGFLATWNQIQHRAVFGNPPQAGAECWIVAVSVDSEAVFLQWC